MTTFPYNRDIPAGQNNPSADRPLMTENTNSIDDIFQVNHTSFEVANGGTHTQIDMFNKTIPTRIGDLLLWAQSSGGQSNLWAANALTQGSGGLPLFTGPASGGVNGYSSIYGGIILQWGVALTSPVTFLLAGNIDFPNNCFNVQATLRAVAGGIITITSISKTGFSYTGGGPSGIYWFAIGN